MEKIKPVHQLDKYGCTIACISMVTGIPYFDIRTILHKEIDKFKTYVCPTLIGLNPGDLLEALKEIFDTPCRFIKFSSLRVLKNHCILYLCPLSGTHSGAHAIVFDAKSRKLIDTSPYGELSDLKDYNVTCCIELC